MTSYLRRWVFQTCFQGEQFRDFPLGFTEAQVRSKIDDEFLRDNWFHDTLRRRGKVKQRIR